MGMHSLQFWCKVYLCYQQKRSHSQTFIPYFLALKFWTSILEPLFFSNDWFFYRESNWKMVQIHNSDCIRRNWWKPIQLSHQSLFSRNWSLKFTIRTYGFLTNLDVQTLGLFGSYENSICHFPWTYNSIRLPQWIPWFLIWYR